MTWNWTHLLAAMAGGGLGAGIRFSASWCTQALRWNLQQASLGTLLVNVIGCLLIGLFLGGQRMTADWHRVFVVTGLLGGLTTFSALGWETFALYEAHGATRAGSYIVLHVALGLLAVFIGSKLA